MEEEFSGESSEVLLRVLESSLRRNFPEVVRAEDEIVLRGLGPSPHTINRRDTAVLRVRRAGDAVLLNADVSFQASALLGDVSQEEIVRSKLERIFEELRTELDFLKSAAGSEDFSVPIAEDTTPAAESCEAREESLAPLDTQQLHPVKARRAPATVGALAAMMLLVVDLPQPLQLAGGFERQSASVMVPDVIPASETKPSVMRTRSTVDDPQLWLDDWATAMRGRDAREQTSFYADTLDSYLGRKDVSREQILADKRAAVLNRKGLWTMRLDDVSVQRSGNDDATLRFAKHYMDQVQGGEITEKIFRTKMQIRRVDGEWKIVSEEDVAAVPVRPIAGLQ